MKRQMLLFVVFLFVMWACSDKETPEDKGTGYLTLNIIQGTSMKADVEVADFTLRISDSEGTEVLSQRIGDLPEQIALAAGSYKVEAWSVAFSEPKFETPCYSGSANIEIVAGETNTASLVCAQSNAGIKVVWSAEFVGQYQTYQAEIRGDAGYLTYSATETRTGYFLPGTVTVNISADGQTLNGGTIMLAARDMVTVTLRPKPSSSGVLAVNITFDETVNAREIEVVVGQDAPAGENSETNPYSVADAIAKQDETAVWISGYIVGSKPSSGWDFINSATWQATNIVLADNITETVDTKCVPVELGTGTFRTNLNLTAHPELLHQKVVIKGNLEAYYSRPGLRSITNYTLQ